MRLTDVGVAFALVALAGLASGLGNLRAAFAKTTTSRFPKVSLGPSAGVRTCVSFAEILSKGWLEFARSWGECPAPRSA